MKLVKLLHDGLVAAYTGVTFYEVAEAFCGMTIEISPDRHTIRLTQGGLTNSLINKALPEHATPMSSPGGPNLMDDTSSTAVCTPEEQKSYLSIVMTIMYLARLTRPDVLLETTYLASRSHEPNQGDMKKLQRVLRYLKGTPQKGIYISCNDLYLYCECDAAYGNHQDGASHTGYWISVGKTEIDGNI
jgi:hypothetical protein